jgi:membrane protease YdiL (CAAX protease family)
MQRDVDLKVFFKAMLFALCVFGTSQCTFYFCLHPFLLLGDQSFSNWEGIFFDYPNPNDWRPAYLTELLGKVLAPSLVCLLLATRLPTITISRSHARYCVAALVFEAVVLGIFHAMGKDESYGSLGKAVLVAAASVPFIWWFARLPLADQADGNRFSGGWLIFAMLAAWMFVVVAKPGSLVAVFLFNLLSIGFAEEYCYRGVIQGYLLERSPGTVWRGISKANLVAATLFAWSHNPGLDPNELPWLLFTFTMGLALGVLRERTGSWFAPALAHGANAFYWLYVMLDAGIN